jgi:hypothetical protein
MKDQTFKQRTQEAINWTFSMMNMGYGVKEFYDDEELKDWKKFVERYEKEKKRYE